MNILLHKEMFWGHLFPNPPTLLHLCVELVKSTCWYTYNSQQENWQTKICAIWTKALATCNQFHAVGTQINLYESYRNYTPNTNQEFCWFLTLLQLQFENRPSFLSLLVGVFTCLPEGVVLRFKKKILLKNKMIWGNASPCTMLY